MAKEKMKLTRIANPRARKTSFKRRMKVVMKKVEELTILCDLDACLTFFNRDDNKFVEWPSQEVVQSLMDRLNSLPSFDRNTKGETQESFIKTSLNKMAKKIVDCRKIVAELEMDHLMVQLENGRSLKDLSQAETASLIAYTNKKIMDLNKKLGYPEHAYTSVNNEPVLKDEILRVMDVTSDRQGYCSNLMRTESIYLMDKWFFDDPKVEEHGDGTHVSTMSHRFDLNLEPSDDEGHVDL